MVKQLAVGQITLTDLNDAIISGTPPTNPVFGALWIDESTDPNLIKKWTGSMWTIIGELLDDGTGKIIEDIEETLGNMANDNLLDYEERKVIKDKLSEITGIVTADTTTTLPTTTTLDSGLKGQFYSVRKSALNAGLLTTDAVYIDLATKYNTLRTYLNGMTPVKPWDLRTTTQNSTISVVKATFRTNWLSYYEAEKALTTATAEKLKQNVEDIVVGGANHARNGNFAMLLDESAWQAEYIGGVKSIVDISTEKPPFQYALRINNTVNGNGGIFTPTIFDGAVAEELLGKDITVSFWLKYQNIVQGAVAHNAGRFGELVIEGLTSTGAKVYSYPRTSMTGTESTNDFILGTDMTWKRHVMTMKLELPATAVKLSKISFSHGLSGCRGEFWTTGIQVEMGNKVTDWKYSDLDVEQRMSSAEFKITDSSIVSTVTSSQAWSLETAKIKNSTDTIADMMSDLKITPVEKSSIKTVWDEIQAKNTQMVALATSLGVSTTALTNAFNALNSTAPRIQTDILANMATTYALTVTTRDTFKTQLNTFFTEAEKLNKAISDKINATATSAKQGMDDIINDMKVTPTEKIELQRHWQRIQAQYTELNAQAVALGVSSAIRTNYTNAYNALNSTTPRIATDILANMTTTYSFSTTTVRDTFKTQLNNYFVNAEKISRANTDSVQTYASTIDQKADSITSTVTGINTRLGQAESKISQTANDITLKVWSDDISEAVDNIEIGGRNYILGSKNIVSDKLNSAVGSKAEYHSVNVGKSYMDIEDETDVTFSFDIEMNVGTRNPYIQFYNSNNKGPKTFSTKGIQLTGEAGDVINKRVEVQTTIKSRADAVLTDNFLEFYTTYGTNNFYKISNIKVEKGNKASDYTLAPEDVDEQIAVAKKSADDAQTTADTAVGNAKTANDLLTDLASDSKLTASEKKAVKKEWDIIVGEKTNVTAQGTKYAISTTAYTNAYNALNTYLSPLLTNLNATSTIVGTTFRATFKTYYDSKIALLKLVSDKAKDLADGAQGTADNLKDVVLPAIEERLSSAEVKIRPDSITSTVTQSTTYKNDLGSKATQGDIDTSIGNLEIGGRNLLVGTNSEKWENYSRSNVSFNKDNQESLIKATRSATGIFGLHQTPDVRITKLLEGDEYVASFEIRGSVGISLNYVYVMNTDTANQNIGNMGTIASEKDFQKVTKVFKKVYNSANSYLMISTSDTGVMGEWFEIKNVQIEKGNKATEWSPALQDTKTDISDAENRAKLDAGWTQTHDVSASREAILVHPDGSALNDAYTYEFQARTTNTGTESTAIIVFKSRGDGQGWTREALYEMGTSSNHPNLFLNSAGKPAIKTWHSSTYAVEIHAVRFRGRESKAGSLASRVSTAEQKITPEAITSTVTSSTTYQNNLASKVGQDEVDASIAKIEIGGRNLIKRLGGDVYDNASIYATDHTKVKEITVSGKKWLEVIATGTFRLTSISLEPDTEYTYSLDTYNANANNTFNITNYFAGASPSYTGRMTITATQTPKRVSGTFRSTNNATYDIPHINSLAIGTRMANFKLEKGNKYSDWTPSIEEVNADIDSAKKSADNANALLGDISSDLKVTPLEKNTLKTTWEAMKAEYTQLLANANALSVSATNYTNAYNAIVNTSPRIELDVLSNMTTTYTFASTGARDAFRTQFNTYFVQAETLHKAVRDKIQANAQTAQNTANTLRDTTIPAIASRVQTAEQKITPEAITATVSASETWTDLTKRMTTAEQKITPSEITATVRANTSYQNDLADKAGKSEFDVLNQSTGNLVNNPVVTGNANGWAGASLDTVDFLGTQTKVIKHTSTTSNQIYGDYFYVDPSKMYEVSMWMKKTQPTPSATNAYIGLNAMDENGATVGVTSILNSTGTIDSSSNTNFYFWSQGGTSSLAEWEKITGYIVPTGYDPSKVKEISNSSRHARMMPNTRKVRIRWLNWSNSSTTPNTTWVAHPKVVEVPVEITGRVADAESKITQTAYDITQRVKTEDYTGNVVASLINQTATTITIEAERVNFKGKMTFESFDATTMNRFTTMETNATNAKNAISDMTSDMKITPLEKNSLKTTWESIKAEYGSLLLSANSLSVSSSACTTAYNAIVNTTPRIEADILANMTTTYSFVSTSARDTFRNQINAYFTQSEALSKAITDKIQSNANTALTNADTANSSIGDLSSDMKVTPLEKNTLKTTWDNMKADYTSLTSTASTLGVSATSLISAYSAILNTSPKMESEVLANMTTTYSFATTTARNLFRTQINNFFTQYGNLQKVINEKLKSNTDSAKGVADNAYADTTRWKKTGTSSIDGGVIVADTLSVISAYMGTIESGRIKSAVIDAGQLNILQINGTGSQIYFGGDKNNFEGRIDYADLGFRFQSDASNYYKVNKGGSSGSTVTGADEYVHQMYAKGSPMFNFGLKDSFNHRFLRGGSNIALKFLNGSTSMLQVRNPADTSYQAIAASDFSVASKREFKQDIIPIEKNMSQVVSDTTVFGYSFKGETKKKIGFIWEESPSEIKEEESISHMNTIGILWKALQEQIQENGKIKTRLDKLEGQGRKNGK